jgi:hypothetical protein
VTTTLEEVEVEAGVASVADVAVTVEDAEEDGVDPGVDSVTEAAVEEGEVATEEAGVEALLGVEPGPEVL